MNGDILKVVKHLEKEKGVDRENLFQAIESALLTASRKKLGEDAETEAHIDRKTGRSLLPVRKRWLRLCPGRI